MNKPKTIGWKECIDFPEWEIFGVITKSDTGAKGSAIDVNNIVELENEMIQFDVALHRKDREKTRTIVAPLSGHTRVKSSNGQVQERYKVETIVKIGKVRKKVELSLVSRKGMICRVLLGRTALGSDFLVNSSEKYLAGKRRRTVAKNIE